MIRKNRAADSMTNTERVVWNTRAVAMLIPIAAVLSYFAEFGLMAQVLFWGAVLILFVAFISLVYDGGVFIEKNLGEGAGQAGQAGQGASAGANLLGKATRLQLAIGIAVYLAPHLVVYAVGLFTPTLQLFMGVGDAFVGDAGAVQGALMVAAMVATTIMPLVLHAAPFMVLMLLLSVAFFFLPSPINMLFITVSLGTFAMAYVLLLVTVDLRDVLLYNLVLLPIVILSSLLSFVLNHHRKSYSMRKK